MSVTLLASHRGAAKWEQQHAAKWHTVSCVLEAHTHASIGNGNVIIPAVGLLELLDVLQLLGERHEHLDQDLCWLQVHPPAASGNLNFLLVPCFGTHPGTHPGTQPDF